jgi:hypothetical protein
MLVNEQLANRKVSTVYGEISFDDQGKCNDLTADQQAELGKLRGFNFQEDKDKAPVKETNDKAPVKETNDKAPVKETNDKAPVKDTKEEEKVTKPSTAPKAKAKKATKNDK